MLEICVIDAGIGIPTEHLERIFDRFHRVDMRLTREVNGLGLGLAISRHIVEMHGGTVRADSPGVGLGATFTVELPLVNQGDTQTRPPAQSDAASGAAAVLKDAYIVVVDDEADSRDLMVSILESAGAEVVAVANAAEGLRAIYEWTPALVISDIGMPYADGFELLRQLRLMGEPHASIPAIALTAYARDEDRQRSLAAGFQAHVGKPFDVETLLGAAADLIEQRRRC